MAQTPRSQRASQPRMDVTFLVTLIICGLIAGAYGYWRVSTIPKVSEDDLAFDQRLDIDAERLERQYRETYGKVELDKVQNEWSALLDAGQRANLAQFEDPSPRKNNELSVELKLLAHQIVPTTGYSRFVVSGEPLFEGCHKGLEVLLADLRDGEIDLETALEDPPEEAYAEYRKNCGKLLPKLVERGLVTEGGEWGFDGAETMVQILHRYRWAHVIYNEKRPRAQLTPYELELMDRWRVEIADGLSQKDRETALKRLVKRNPDYNDDFARGILAYQAGDFDAAVEHFESLAEESPAESYQAYADFIREQQGARDPSDPGDDKES